MTAITSVIQIGLNALPGVGQAVGAGLTLAYQAAQVAAYTFESSEAAAQGYNAWLQDPSSASMDSSNWVLDKACGNKYTPPEAEKIFGAFNMASSSVGIGSLWKGAPKAWPPPFSKGSGSTDDMLDYLADLGGRPRPKGGKPDGGAPKDSPPKTDSPKTDPAKTTDAAKTSEPSSTAAKSCTKRNSKRAPGKGSGKTTLSERTV